MHQYINWKATPSRTPKIQLLIDMGITSLVPFLQFRNSLKDHPSFGAPQKISQNLYSNALQFNFSSCTLCFFSPLHTLLLRDPPFLLNKCLTEYLLIWVATLQLLQLILVINLQPCMLQAYIYYKGSPIEVNLCLEIGI